MNFALFKLIVSLGFGFGFLASVGLFVFLSFIKPVLLEKLVKQLENVGVSKEDSQKLYLESGLNIYVFYRSVQELVKTYERANFRQVIDGPKRFEEIKGFTKVKGSVSFKRLIIKFCKRLLFKIRRIFK